MSHLLRCECGSLTGTLEASALINRGICYCKDCQMFAFVLGQEARVLDVQGGTDIVQTSPSAIRITRGHAHLGCLRLTSKGMLRWYATCCDSPIGNTPLSPSLAVVGLVHTIFGDVDLNAVAPSRMRVFTTSARGEPKPRQTMPFTAGLKLVRMVVTAHIRGAIYRTPFFDAAGAPAVVPRILSAEEHARFRAAVA